jgi:23S rRNA (adenine1618-N6)-methyltransferase
MGVLNFGGQASELWCEGGELGFVQRMIAESARVPRACRWFTTLVSKSEHVPRLRQALRAVNAAEVRTIDMTHGQKKSRILAWSFRTAPLTAAVRPR